jgi:hypothetical protein
MSNFKPASLKFALLCLAVLSFVSIGQAADTQDAVDITIDDAVAKVGETTYVIAKITPRAGFTIADNYRNNITKLSTNDEGVEFPNKIVRAKIQDGVLHYRVPVVPKRAGEHAINGMFRFAFVSEFDGKRELDIKWAPLTAKVTAKD